ncbi:hypothetical protein RND81_01G014400 [Saponaria officinalis]
MHKLSSMNEVQDEALPPSAHNLFDEMSEPDTSNSHESSLVSDAEQVFDETPEVDSTSENTLDSNIKFGAHQVFDKTPKLKSSVYVIEEQSTSNFVEEEQFIGALQAIDEIPVPDFILEMAAQAAKTAQGTQSLPPSNAISNCHATANIEFTKSKFGSIDEGDDAKLPSAHKMVNKMPWSTIDRDLAQDDSIKENYESALKVLDDHDDFSKCLHVISGKLGAFDDLYFQNSVIIGLRQKHSSVFSSMFHGDHQLANRMLHNWYELCDVKSSCGLCDVNSSSQVKTESTKTFTMLSKLRCTDFIANVVWQFSVSEMNWCIGLSLSMILDIEMKYNIRVFELKIGWMANITYKEVLSWGNLNVELDVWKPLASIIELPSFQNDTTCSWINGNGTILHVLVFIIKQSNNAHLPFGFTYVYPCTLLCMLLNELGGNKMRSWAIIGVEFKRDIYMCFSFFEGRIMLFVLHDLCLKTLPLFEFSYSRIIVVFSTLIFTLTLEDKGGFEEVGSNSVRLLSWRTLSSWRTIKKNICERKCLLTSNNIFISIRASYFIFDPGGLNNFPMLKMRSFVAAIVWVFDVGGLVAMIVLVFDPGGSNNLQGL